jgi:uncharacterized membrane protein YphA (DoxX/SURF4 family)
MNFVTPKKRQEWLGQAEDYADIVKHPFSFYLNRSISI